MSNLLIAATIGCWGLLGLTNLTKGKRGSEASILGTLRSSSALYSILFIQQGGRIEIKPPVINYNSNLYSMKIMEHIGTYIPLVINTIDLI